MFQYLANDKFQVICTHLSGVLASAPIKEYYAVGKTGSGEARPEAQLRHWDYLNRLAKYMKFTF